MRKGRFLHIEAGVIRQNPAHNYCLFVVGALITINRGLDYMIVIRLILNKNINYKRIGVIFYFMPHIHRARGQNERTRENEEMEFILA